MKKQITLSVAEMNLVRAALEFAVEHVYDSQGEVDAFAWKAPADFNLMLAQEASKLKTALMKMDYDEYVIRGQAYDEAPKHLSVDEEWVLNELNENLYAAVDDMLSKYDNDPEYSGEEFITITVGGKSHKLLLGGPQVAGMKLLIESICNENGYTYPVRECEK